MKTNYLVLVALIFLGTACATSNPNSFQKKGERVVIEPIGKAHGLTGIEIATLLAPKLIEWGGGKLKTFFEKRSKEYKAEYGKRYIGDDFYAPQINPRTKKLDYKLRYGGFRITRFVKEGNKEIQASVVEMLFDVNKDKTLLTLRPTLVKIDKTKARLKKKDNTVDIIVNIKLNGLWIDQKQIYKNETVVDVSFELKNLSLGSEYFGEGKGNNYVLKNKEGKVYKNIKSNWFFSIPISVDKNGEYLTNTEGNYSLFIKLTEVDDYGDKVAKFSEYIGDGITPLSDAIKNLLSEEKE